MQPSSSICAAPPGPAIAALLARATAEERRHLMALLADWTARLTPIDSAETAAVEAIVATIWRAERLVAIEAQVVEALARGAPAAGLPSLATLARLRRRLAEERREAEHDLRQLWKLRPEALPVPALNPARLEWLAAKIRAGKISPFLNRERAAEGALRGDGEVVAAAASRERPSAAPPPVHEAPEPARAAAGA